MNQSRSRLVDLAGLLSNVTALHTLFSIFAFRQTGRSDPAGLLIWTRKTERATHRAGLCLVFRMQNDEPVRDWLGGKTHELTGHSDRRRFRRIFFCFKALFQNRITLLAQRVGGLLGQI